MTKRMLIDATHDEETRVAVVDGTRLMEFDYESQVRKQIKGSIFLAKVTRVEPSLQAAFVNFGGNRHGFLPFAEIHPDYYRIPIADREALLAEQRAEMEARDAEDRAMEEEEERAAAGLAAGAEAGEQDESEDDEEDDDIVEEIGGEKPPVDESDEDLEEETAEETEELVAEEDAAEEESEAEEIEEVEVEAEITLIPLSDLEEAAEEEIAAATAYPELPEQGDAQDGEEDPEESIGNIAAPSDEEIEENEVNGNTEAGHRGESVNGEANRGRGDRNRGRGRGGRGGDRGRGRGSRSGGRHVASSSRRVEVLGGDGVEGDRPVRPTSRRHYKIQEVIKRGQIMLVQASKEERGNKGAAVTTYLSLPGRYCVLMPNSPRGGGVSRKIANFAERKRMREILSELNVPEGMSVIMRTAGMSRTKVEIKRDCDYLLRLWDEIRELTLQSNAPAIIHEEGKLIRRAVRDLYSRDIEEIVVSGEEGYKAARDFMKVMMPSHSKRVIQYKDEQIPLFHRYQVESQIREMGEPNVTLKSGGYLVINPTEALVSIDVNSGRATRERHIEETALKTNMEAAEEVARQLRLRDLGGLVVIDFIDMEDRRNNAKVERKLKESLSSDRARIQMGRISSFGLMEMSRQRLNPSLTEAQFEKCKLCQGQGHTRTVDNAAILAMRGLEEEGVRARSAIIQLGLPSEVAIYVLNHKRYMLADIERRYEFQVTVRIDDTLLPGAYKIERMRIEVDADDEDGEGESRPQRQPRSEENSDRDNNRGRGRNDRNNDRNRNRPRRDEESEVAAQGEESGEGENNAAAGERASDEEGAEGERSSRRRGRRGGRGRNRGDRNRDGAPREGQVEGQTEGDAQTAPGNAAEGSDASEDADDNIGNRAEAAPREGSPRRERGGRNRGGRNRGGDRGDRQPRTEEGAEQGADQPRTERPARAERPRRDDNAVAASGETPSAEPRKSVEPKFYGRRSSTESSDPVANDAPHAAEEKPYAVVSEPDGQKKKGWWNRLVE